MGRKVLLTLFFIVLAAAAAAGYIYYRGRQLPLRYLKAGVERGRIAATVNATGTLNATVTVQVGSQVSGNILKLFVDYNSPVTENQIIAQIDPAPFETKVTQERAMLASAQASVQVAKATVENGKAAVETARANAESAKANVEKSKVALTDAKRTLDRSKELLEILQQARQRAMALRQEEPSEEGRRARVQALRDQISAQVRNVLTDEQRQKYDELLKDAEGQRRKATADGRVGRVWVLNGEGKAEPTAMTLGISDDTFTEVASGDLHTGQEVITGLLATATRSDSAPPGFGSPRL